MIYTHTSLKTHNYGQIIQYEYKTTQDVTQQSTLLRFCAEAEQHTPHTSYKNFPQAYKIAIAYFLQIRYHRCRNGNGLKIFLKKVKKV